MHGLQGIIDTLVDLTRANFRLEAYVQSLLETTQWEWRSNGAIFNGYLGKAIRLKVLRDIVGVIGLSGKVGDQMIANEVTRLFPTQGVQNQASKASNLELLLQDAAAKSRMAEGGLLNNQAGKENGPRDDSRAARVGTYVSKSDR